jgi:uncharacterized protein with PIN domain
MEQGKQAQFSFSGELNQLLPKVKRNITFTYAFNGNQSIKHLIESLGIPHTEIGKISINGHPVDLHYLVQDRDEVSVSPPQGESPLGMPTLPPTDALFALDNHLGRLAAYLRMLGIDTHYQNYIQDEELVAYALENSRVVLTRDRQILMRKVLIYGYLVRSKDPQQQIVEIVNRFNLGSQIKPFFRCLRCNGVLQPVAKVQVMHLLEPLTKKYYDEFSQCTDCQQVYWKGSHYQRMLKIMSQVLPSSAAAALGLG